MKPRWMRCSHNFLHCASRSFSTKTQRRSRAIIYTLTVTTSNGSYAITITDPGGTKNPIGEYNGLTFEVSRFFLEKVTSKFTPGATPAPSEMLGNSPPQPPL